MQSAETDCAVVIVGGGPVGLATALQLGRYGVPTQLVERRSGPTRHPKATGVHAKTMELMRQWGVADEVRAASGVGPDWTSFAWVTRVTGEELGTIDLAQDVERLTEAMAQSPEFLAWCAQDVIEPILLRAAQQYDSVRIRYGTELQRFAQSDRGVEVVVAAADGGADPETLRADYLVAADGAASGIRDALGIQAPATPAFGHHINVCFRADLSSWTAGRNHMMWWVVNAESRGTLVTLDGADRWIYHLGYDADRQRPEDFPPEVCVDLIRRAIDAGAPEIPIEIESVVAWHLDTALAERFSDGRVFLVGDAAHRFPPTGGFGMNSGIGDAHNLAWKLAAVTRGTASAGLLDTYDQERRPVAELNTRQAMINTERTAEVGWVLFDPEAIARIEQPEGADVRAAIAAAIPNQREGYWSQGQQFGSIYESSAVVPDGTDPVRSTISDYRMNAGPGARAPHLWLEGPDGGRLSTVDLLHTRFVLLAGPAGDDWKEALGSVAAELGLDAGGFTVGRGADYRDAEGDFLALYGLSESGAVLVRPDGHVAFRAAALVGDPEPALRDALAQVLHAPVPSNVARS